jgi:hypothetical protein
MPPPPPPPVPGVAPALLNPMPAPEAPAALGALPESVVLPASLAAMASAAAFHAGSMLTPRPAGGGDELPEGMNVSRVFASSFMPVAPACVQASVQASEQKLLTCAVA